MAGYLDQYGTADARREKVFKYLIVSTIATAIVGGTLFFFLKNYRQEGRVSTFVNLLGQKQYREAYALWGCTEATPCPEYQFEKFMEDWGPDSPNADVSSANVSRSRSCGEGVIVSLRVVSDREEKLWVDRESLAIGFSPWPGCPH
ncbi:MAG: hypothetical protein WD696_03675 [Bryobacteraceae bacterium]